MNSSKFTDEEVESLCEAGVPVPRNLEEARALLQEAEQSDVRLTPDEVRRNLAIRLMERFPELKESA